jgi:copper transport protein
VADLTVEGDTPYEIAAAITRFVTYVAAFLAAGLAIFLAFVHDQTHDRWRLAPIVRIASLFGGMVAIANVAVQAALLTGEGLAAMTDVSTLRGSLAEGLGWQSIVLLVGLAAVHLSTDTERLMVAQVLAFYGGVTVAVSFVFWGHAREAPNAVVAVVANGLHTTTAMVWFGGLVGLVQVLRWRWRSADADVGATAAMVARFSTMAGACVAVLLVAGAVLSWQEVGSRAAFTSTTYGRVLLAKVLVVLVVLVAAAYNRFVLVPDIDHLTGEAADDDWPHDESGEPGASVESGRPPRRTRRRAGTLATVTSTRAPAQAWTRGWPTR